MGHGCRAGPRPKVLLEEHTMIEIFAGRYRLLRRLGKGGMGEVFLARDLTNGGECALKRLSPDAAFAEVRHEFEILTRLRHPAVVSVLEFGTAPDGTPYYTMEFVPGLRSDHAIALGDWPSLFFFAAEVAQGLEALHSLPVFHGDVKPTN
jgi:serine/threonine protein kinase